MENRKRWYLLWFVGTAIWLLDFFGVAAAGAGIGISVFMKLLAAVLFFVAGVVGHCRYNKNKTMNTKRLV